MIDNSLLFVLIATILITTQVSSTLSTNSGDDNKEKPTCEEFFFLIGQNAIYKTPLPKAYGDAFFHTLTLSGHGINDLGDYYGCTETTNQTTKYFTTEILLNKSSVGYMGLCGPSFCSKEQYEKSQELLLNSSIVEDKIPKGTELAFFDPSDQTVNLGIPGAIFWIIVSFSILMILSSCFINTTTAQRTKLANDSKDFAFQGNSINELLLEDCNSKEENKQRESKLRKFINCFNINKALHDVFITEKVPGHDEKLNIFSAIRTLAYFSIVLGHTTSGSLNSRNLTYIQTWLQSYYYLSIYGIVYAVDIFFWLSGFLTGFLMISKLKKMKPHPFSYLQVIFHRWMRLWPAYAFCILFFWRIMPNISSGPLWMNTTNYTKMCDTNAWKNYLLVDNIYDSQGCFGWGWYIALDFQIFLIIPILIWVYIKNKTAGKITFYVAVFIAIFGTYWLAQHTDSPYDTKIGVNFFQDFYIKPIARAAPYIIGVYIGILYKNYKQQSERNIFNHIEDSRVLGYVSFAIGILGMLFIVYYPRTLQLDPNAWSMGFRYFWQTISRPVFTMAMFLFIVPILVGHLTWIKNIMCANFFIIASKLTFTGYLFHYMVFGIMYNQRVQEPIFSNWYLVKTVSIVILITMIPALIVHILVEKPIINLEGAFLNPKPKKSDAGKRKEFGLANNVKIPL